MAVMDQQAGQMAATAGETAMKWMRRASITGLFLSAAAFAPGSESIMLDATGVNEAGNAVAELGKVDMLTVPLQGAGNILSWGGDAVSWGLEALAPDPA